MPYQIPLTGRSRTEHSFVAHCSMSEHMVLTTAISLCLQVGGFQEWPLLEDVDLVTRVKHKAAAPPAIIPLPVYTSGRRWERLGFWRNAALNQAIILGWQLGVDVHTLASWYYPARNALSK